MAGVKAKRLLCSECDIRFTLFTMRKTRKRYFCPLCGDSASVSNHIHAKHPFSDVKGTRPRWNVSDQDHLIKLFNETNYSYKDMGHVLGKSEKSIRGQLYRLKKAGRI